MQKRKSSSKRLIVWQLIQHLVLVVLLPLVLLISLAPLVADAQTEKLPFQVPRSKNELPETALIETSQGPFEVEFFTDDAPITVKNFVYLAEKNYYQNVKFHRFVPNYLVQGGDPSGTGKGGPGYRLPPEFSKRKHLPGTLGMARLPDPVNPERLSNGSQFYIMLAPAPHLDGLYTVFAQVIRGMDVVERLRENDKITVVRLPRRR